MSRFITIEKLEKFYIDLKEKIKNNYYSKLEVDDLMSPIEQTVGDLELRTHIGKQLDYGEFRLSSDFSGNIGDKLPLVKTLGNINIDENGNILLEAYKKYKIIISLVASNRNDISIYNEANSEIISYQALITNVINSTATSKILEVERDTKISFKIDYMADSSTIYRNPSLITIEEIGRQVILDPAEEAKNIEFDRGYFTINYPTGTVLTQNQSIKFDNKINGNLEIDSNGGIILKANKEYVIDYGIQCHTINSNVTFALYDLNTNKEIQNTRFYPFASDAGYNYTSSTSRSLRLIPESDISLVAIQLQNKSFSIVTDGCFMNIREDAHPYYFNYFKDSIGSKILFEGTANLKGEYSLNDDVANYEWLIVEWESALVSNNLRNFYEDRISINGMEIGNILNRYVLSRNFTISSSSSKYSNIVALYFKDNKTLTILDIQNDGAYSIGKGITRITGYGFNYDNPYKDLISSGNSNEI